MNLIKVTIVVILISIFSNHTKADSAAEAKAMAEALKAGADARRTDLLSPLEAAKMEAETQKLFAEAVKTISEAHLNEAKTAQCYAEIERLRQRMRITEYEFGRITSADYKMNEGITFIEQNTNLTKSLIMGKASMKTWIGLETLMMRFGNVDIISQAMFDIPVPEIPADQFISNEYSGNAIAFKGGNLGEFYNFVKDNDLSFKKFGTGHKQIMRVVSMVCKAADLAIMDLRNVNQAIRLTIAHID
jgi:hypothetical protein